MRAGLRTPTRVVLLIAAYFLGGLLGKSAAFMKGDVALVWPPAGIAFAAILLFGYRFLPGVLLGAILFSLVDGKPLGFFTFGTAIGNSVGAMVCTYMLRQSVDFRNSLERVKDTVAFIGLAACLGTTINALFNVASLYVTGRADWDNLGEALVVWWVPNAMGCIVITPLFLAWSQYKVDGWTKLRWIEAAACMVGLLLATMTSFETWLVYGIKRYPLAFLPYPFLIWASLRFGSKGATLATAIVSSAAIHALLENRGPFVTDTETESLLLIGSYIAVLAIANLLLAAASAERTQSERRYRAVVEDQTERICRFDRQGNLTFVNEAFCRARGKKHQELLATSFLPQISAQDLEIPLSRFLQLTKEEPILSYDARLHVPGGSPTWENCSVRALFDESGAICEFQMVSQDITRRKQTEEALRASEEKMKAILVDGILELDKEGMIVSSNPAAERIFKLYGAELTTRRFADLLYENDRERYERYLATTNATSTTDIELRGKRGEDPFPMNVCVSGMAVNGQAGYMVVVRDMTERKEADEQLRHAQKMETVGHLAGGIAHDFNNLLSIIIGHMSLMLERQNVSERAAKSARQVLRAAERGAKLTRQLLMFSRRQPMQPKRLNLNETVNDLGKMLGRVLGENIALEFQCCAEELFIRADEGMLDQVLVNLSVNARDAMPNGGKLTIETGTRTVTDEEARRNANSHAGTFAFLRVTDTGCGIPAEILPRIFEPFFTTKEVGKGTGLGLSTVYGIIQQHKGWVDVTSRVGVGTTFHIYVPLFEEQSQVPLPSPAAEVEMAA